MISDLFHYYEDNMEYEYNKNYEDDLYWGSSISRYDERYARIYLKCKAIMDRLEGSSSVIAKTAENLKDRLSSEYMSQQIELIDGFYAVNKSDKCYRNGKGTYRKLL